MPPEDNPSWKEILDVLPTELHSVVTPVLRKWDDGVREHLAEVTGKANPYKEFSEAEIDPEDLKRGYFLLQQMQEDPAMIVAQAIDAFDLNFISKDDIEIVDDSSDDDNFKFDEDDDVDILKHPAIVQMSQTLEQLQATIDKAEADKAEAAQASQFEQQLAALKETHGDFNPLVVTALMSQGVAGEEAVKAYKDAVNQAAATQLQTQGKPPVEQPSAPIVMGGEGTTGSGLAESQVDLGSMTKTGVNDLVVQMLENQQS